MVKTAAITNAGQQALMLGWVVYRCDPAMVKSGDAVKTAEILVGMR